MEGATSFGLTISFTAGLLSFLSPCVLPLVPSYITFITGMSLEDVQHARRAALVHALLFVAGFSAIFILLGAGATALGQVLRAYETWITRLGGILVIVFGLYLLGVFNIAAFSQERRLHLADKPAGYRQVGPADQRPVRVAHWTGGGHISGDTDDGEPGRRRIRARRTDES